MKKMLRSLWLVMTLLFGLPALSVAQDCSPPTTISSFRANKLTAPMSASGTLWWDGRDEGLAVYTPYGSAPRVQTLFASGIWLGGFDPGGNLKLAASTYGWANQRSDFYAGPLRWGGLQDPARGTPTAESCTDWDKVWEVRRHEVETFRADFADDGLLEGQYPNVFAWPGYGNPFFLASNGFELPETVPQGLAPFFDTNQDGRYNPADGDYPHIPQSVVQPDLISWAVFHDVGPHLETNSQTALQMEIQHTAWAYDCEAHPWLNETLFSSFKLTNVAIENIDSFHFGLWTDPDLGCHTDDYLGSAPALNTFYTYNEDAVDGTVAGCQDGVARFTESPAVQAVTYLNAELASFTVYERSVPPELIGTTDPEISPEYYHYLSGSFRDGTPMTRGGNGYNPGAPTATRTSIAYPDRPDDPSGWSMFQEDIGVGDRRCIGSMYFEEIPPGEVRTVDVAYSYHHHPDSNHLENVNLMYDQVASLQAIYATQFNDLCAQRERCEDDCVWAGDANADGIANHYDLLPIMYAQQSVGALRNPPVIWAPQAADPWGNPLPTHPAVDTKHADCDADGEVRSADFALTRRHLGLQRPDYVAPADRYQEGPELVFRPRSTSDDFLEMGVEEAVRCVIVLTEEVPGLRGLAFELEYDTNFLAPIKYIFNLDLQQFRVEEDRAFYVDLLQAGQIDLAYYQLAGEVPTNARLHWSTLELKLREGAALEGLPNDTTCIRFKNIVAYDAAGNPLEIGGQTAKVTISEDIMVGYDEVVEPASLQVFPNPAREQLTVRGGREEIQAYQIFDLQGRLIQEEVGAWHGLLRIDLKQLSAGMYYLRVERKGYDATVERFVRL